MRILVVASSFPSLNQPWLTTYIEQLIENDIDFNVLSFKNPNSIDKSKFGIQHIFEKTIFLENSPRLLISNFIHDTLTDKYAFLKYGCKCIIPVLHFQLNWKLKLRILLIGAYIASKLSNMNKYDLIHVHFDQDVGQIIPYAELSKTPVITTFHGLNPVGVPKLKANYRKFVYSKVCRIFLNTNFAAGQISELGADKNKIAVLPQGIRLANFPFIERSTPLKDEHVKILTVGRLQGDKGQMYALLALKRLRIKGKNVSWTFIGSGPDSDKLKQTTKKLGLESDVKFLHKLDSQQLLYLYQNANIFVLPSISNTYGYHIETQGVVLQEAQASGAITIGTKVGGIPECINDKSDGLLIKEKSSKAICSAITYLLENPNIWNDLRNNARRRLTEQFSSEYIGKQMIRHYQKILTEHT